MISSGPITRLWTRGYWIEGLIISVAVLWATAVSLSISPTTDEGKHILNGIAFLDTGDRGLHDETPSSLLHAIFLDDQDLALPHVPVIDGHSVYISNQLFERNSDRSDEIRILARIPTLIVFGGFLVIFAAWSRLLFSTGTARLVLLLAAFEPNLLAHATLASSDFLLTAAAFAGAFFLYRYALVPTFWRASVFGVVLGLSLVAKLSGLFVWFGLLLALGFLVAFRRPPEGVARPLRVGLDHIVCVVLLSLAVFNGAYSFSETGASLRKRPTASAVFSKLKNHVWASLPLPVPQGYIRAVDYVLEVPRKREELGMKSFMAGEAYLGARWTYFPFALAVKTPLLILLLGGMGLWMLRRHSQRAVLYWILLFCPGVFLLGNILFNEFNIGVRYVLPVIPFLILISGFALSRKGGGMRIAKTICIPLHLVLVLGVFPNYIAYFNATSWVVPKDQLLTDSNLDWGQMDHLVSEDFKAHQYPAAQLHTMGPKDPEIRSTGVYGAPGRRVLYLSKNKVVWLDKAQLRNLGEADYTLGEVIDVYVRR